MTTRATDLARPFELGDIEEYPVIAADIIYQGSAVGENGAGFARPLVAGDPFLGFADRRSDNAAGAAGDVTIRVKTKGKIVIPVTGASAVTANDRPPVYASDDDTFTLTATGNTKIGNVSRWISGTTCVVEFDASPTSGTTALAAPPTAFANGAAAATGTLTNAPAAGNPTKWIPVNDAGTIRYIPAW
jgi:hypothetical protein